MVDIYINDNLRCQIKPLIISTGIQEDIKQWHELNFPHVMKTQIIAKVVEEAVEILNTHNNDLDEHGHRATALELSDKEIEEIGDVGICLIALCSRCGVDLGDIITQRWCNDVSQRSTERIHRR